MRLSDVIKHIIAHTLIFFRLKEVLEKFLETILLNFLFFKISGGPEILSLQISGGPEILSLQISGPPEIFYG